MGITTQLKQAAEKVNEVNQAILRVDMCANFVWQHRKTDVEDIEL